MLKLYQTFKKLAIFAAVLCVFFMLATVALAITLGMKMRSFQNLDNSDNIPNPLFEVVNHTVRSLNYTALGSSDKTPRQE